MTDTPINVAIIGAGKIGQAIYSLLAFDPSRYHAYLVDGVKNPKSWINRSLAINQINVGTDAGNDELTAFLKERKIDYVINALPWFMTEKIARIALTNGVKYLDLTEDLKQTDKVKTIAKNYETVAVPQCGLAPGVVSMIAGKLAREFDVIDSIKIRVGALPRNPNNIIKYNSLWSTQGLVNEYMQPCKIKKNERMYEVPALSDLETLVIEGETYEAFLTSGGMGTFNESPLIFDKQASNLDYKSIRYPGHCNLIKFLRDDLLMTHKEMAEYLGRLHSITDDVVLIHVSVSGMKDDVFSQENYTKRIYGSSQTAIQATTAMGVFGVLELLVADKIDVSNHFVNQHDISFDDFLAIAGEFVYG